MWTEISNYHWGWMGFGFIHMALIWAFFILAIILMIRFSSSGNKSDMQQSIRSPIDVLKLRYARGEISQQQFGQFKQKIRE